MAIIRVKCLSPRWVRTDPKCHCMSKSSRLMLIVRFDRCLPFVMPFLEPSLWQSIYTVRPGSPSFPRG
jgi:hypothetical protein